MSSKQPDDERRADPAGTMKPAIPETILENWRDSAAILAGLAEGACVVIMRGAGGACEIVVSAGEGNPYRPGGLEAYPVCERHVAAIVREGCEVSAGNVCSDGRRRGEPDGEPEMQAFLGLPIFCPKGGVFGAVCVLSPEEIAPTTAYRRLLARFRDEMERDAKLLLLSGIDVPSDERRIETEKRLGEHRFSLLLEHIADSFIVHDDQGRFLDVNHHMTSSTGFTREELLRMQVADIAVDFDLAWGKEVWGRSQPGAATTIRARHRRKDGSIFPVEVRLSCQFYQGEKTFFATVRDITERVEAENDVQALNVELERRVAERTGELRKTADLLKAIFEGTTDAIFLKDREGRFVMANQAASRFLGKPVNEVVGKDLWGLIDPVSAERILHLNRRIMDGAVAVTMEESFTADGVRHDFSVTKVPYRNEAGEVIGLIGVARDITAMRATEEALRRSEARWEFAVNGVGDGVWDWDMRTGHVFYSRQWKAMLGYAEDEIGPTLGEFLDRVHPDDAAGSWETVQRHFRGEIADFVFELRMRAKDGGWRTILGRGKAIERAEDGSPLRVIGTHTDITARKQMEEKLASRASWLSEMVENLPVGAVFVSGTKILINRAIEELTGYGREELADRDAWCLRFGLDMYDALTVFEADGEAGRPFRVVQFSFYRKDGALRLAEFATTRVGEHVIWLMRDVTQARELEAQLGSLVDNLPHGAVYRLVQTPDGGLSLPYVSAGILALTGVPAAEIMARRGAFVETIHEDDLPRYNALIQRSLAGGSMFDCEFRARRRDSRIRWLHCRSAPRYQANGTVIWDGVMQDITARKQAEELVIALKERMELAIRVGGVGIWELNFAEQTYIWDDQMYLLYGLERGRFDGSLAGWLELVHPDDADRVLTQWRAVASGSTPFQSEFRIVHPDGTIRYIQSLAQVFRAEDGSLVRALGINQDVTDQRQTAEALIEARLTAEAAEAAKGEFLAVMSHEIRTPMNTVLGMTRLALKAERDPKQRNYLDKIAASAQTLTSILNDILDYSKIEAGKLDLEEREFSLEAVLESVSAVTAMKAEEKGIEIVYAVSPEVPARLVGDSLRLGQVLINLVNNAVKFTHRGEIVVSVDVDHPVSPEAIRLRFGVRDTGIGLDGEQMAGLFQAFTQAERHVSREYGGTGLGLAICKRLVERMDGRIWVSSVPGKGSTFAFTIHARLPERAAPRREGRRQPELMGRRVLIVDDNASAREILAMMVRDFDMDARAVGSGAEALAALTQASREDRPFEMVLLDWRMPVMDGLETAQKIKTDSRLWSTPTVLMVTAYGRDEVLRRAERLGLHGVLIKPVTVSVMFSTVAGIFLDARPGPDPDIAAPAREGSLAALSGRRVLVVDDNALNREVVGDFLQLAGIKAEMAVNGRDALARLEEGDYDAVLMDVHMPEMDGLTAARKIRARERWESLPLIALTAQALLQDREASLAAGMNAHLTKPVDEAVLYRTLLEWLPAASPSSSDPQAPARARASPRAPAERSALDLSSALKRLGGSQERLSRLLRGFVRDFGKAPSQLSEHESRQDAEAVAALAHAVKGAAAYFDADELCRAAAQLEQAARRSGLHGAGPHLPRFRICLEQVLAQLDGVLADGAWESGKASRADALAVLELIGSAEPLLRSGDYAACPLLDEINARLTDTAEGELAKAVLAHFEELELDEAEAALRQLGAGLEQRVLERSRQ